MAGHCITEHCHSMTVSVFCVLQKAVKKVPWLTDVVIWDSKHPIFFMLIFHIS